MYTTKILVFLLFLVSFSLHGCKKDYSYQQVPLSIAESKKIKEHQLKVETWLKLIPLNGHFDITNLIQKNAYATNLYVTKFKFGKYGNSLLFVSNNGKFHVYGINSNLLANTYTGNVIVYDFQNLSKYNLTYKNSRLEKTYLFNKIDYGFNAYQNLYTTHITNTSSELIKPKSSDVNSSSSSNNILDGVRKFFCELFGGTWIYAPHALDFSEKYCAPGSDNEEQNAQSVISPTGGGSNDIGNLINLINNPSYFDINSGLWQSVLPTYIGGGNNGGNNIWSTTSMPVDAECVNPDQIRTLFFALNTKYNQQTTYTNVEGSVEEMLFEFENYKNQQQVLIPIIPWLIKAGANGTADAFLQALFIYLTEGDCPSFGAAFGHDKFSKTQVARSAAEGLIPWHTPGGKLGKAAFTAIGDIMANLINGKYGEHNYQAMGQDFMLGFFSDLAGGAVGELASKYAIPKIGKGLLNKFDIHYKTACSWLGGGIQQVNKTFSHASAYGGNITATKIMKGFADNKVVVIGRNMDDRVVPFAQKLSQELGFNVVTIKQWSGWNPNLTVEQNRAWLQQLKNEGYTFYDIGLDPRFTSGAATGTPDFTEGPFYSMELNEIFR